MDTIIKLLKDEEGQSMVEYGILIALISIVAIAVIKAVGHKLHSPDNQSGAFDHVNTQLQYLPPGNP